MKKIIGWIFKLLIGLGIISYIIYSNRESLFNSLVNFDKSYLIFAIVILITQMGICGIRWFALLKLQNIDISLKDVLLLSYKSFFMSLVIPGGTVGGDIAKVSMLTCRMEKGARVEPNLTIFIDRIIGMLALFIIALIIVISRFDFLINLNIYHVENYRELNLMFFLGIIGVCLLGIMGTILIFLHNFFEKIKIVAILLERLDKFTNNMISRLKNAIDIYRKNLYQLLFWVVVSIFFVHMVVVLIVWILAMGLGVEVPSLVGLITAVIIGSLAGFVPFAPSGIGIRDFVMLSMLESVGIKHAATLVILNSMVLIISNLLSGIAFLIPDRAKVAIVDNRQDKD